MWSTGHWQSSTAYLDSLTAVEYRKCLRAMPVAIKMKTRHKAGFPVRNKPKAVFVALYMHQNFIRVPLVRVEMKCWNELNDTLLKHRSEAGKPVADSGEK